MQFMVSLERTILALSRALFILFMCEVLGVQQFINYPYPPKKWPKLPRNDPKKAIFQPEMGLESSNLGYL
jgi:hypothetical protein